MASTALNVPSLSSSSRSCPSFSLRNSSCHVSATSLTFQNSKNRSRISCHARRGMVFVHPIKSHELGYGLFTIGLPQCGAADFTRNPRLIDGDWMVAKAAEVAAPTTEEAASPQSKSSKKGKGEKYPRRMIDMYQMLRNPVITEAAVKNIAKENSLSFTVDVRADKKMIKDAINNFFGVKVKKVNTSIRPDGTKKAFIMLSKEYNASDIAKSIGIFPGSD